MKKFFMLSVLSMYAIATYSQTLDEVNALMDKKKYSEAKTSIDKMLLDAKNTEKADVWYFKGRIYNSYSYDTSLTKEERSTLKTDAFAAFKKYQQMDSKDIRMKFENYGSYIDLYGGFYDLGAQQFNEKKYSEAANNFIRATEVESYILSKDYTYNQVTLHPLDTALVLNIGIASLQDKNKAQAIQYFKKLADANVSGKDYLEVYEYLADEYSKANDEANLQLILDKGRKFYPQDAGYWNDLEVKSVGSKGDKAALYAKYEEMMAKNPTDFTLAYNYSIELYNSLYSQDVPRPADIPATKDKLTTVLKSAIQNDPGIDADVLMVNHLYNDGADFTTNASLVKGTKPTDLKKKADLKASAIKKMDECIPYIEAAVKYYQGQTVLKATQKATFQNMYSYLVDIYNLKGDAKKAAEYQKLKSTIKF
jgi:hypothetical protein